MKEFDGVESKIQKDLEDDKYNPKEKHQFLKKSDKSLPPKPERRISDKKERKLSVPSAHVKREEPQPPKNYLADNKEKVIKMEAKKYEPKPLVPPVDSKHQTGKIPDYLIKRKIQKSREDEKRRLNAPDPDCPDGMIVLPEDERISTLRTLQETEREVEESLNRMPLVIETPSMIRRQKELEEKLKETKDAIKIFSQSKVFVMPD